MVKLYLVGLWSDCKKARSQSKGPEYANYVYIIRFSLRPTTVDTQQLAKVGWIILYIVARSLPSSRSSSHYSVLFKTWRSPGVVILPSHFGAFHSAYYTSKTLILILKKLINWYYY